MRDLTCASTELLLKIIRKGNLSAPKIGDVVAQDQTFERVWNEDLKRWEVK